MEIRTRIKRVAKARGLTAAEVARKLGGYRSNLSALDAGRRSISLKMLARLCEILSCSPGDLLEGTWVAEDFPLFRKAALNRKLSEREMTTVEGAEKGWVHAALLAWQRHHLSLKRVSR